MVMAAMVKMVTPVHVLPQLKNKNNHLFLQPLWVGLQALSPSPAELTVLS